VPRQALDLPFRGRALRDVALDVLAMAREGLRRRARTNSIGEDESYFLDTLFAIAGSGRTLADELLDEFANKWNGDIDPIFREHAY
jgi:glutamate--cysteine ligase